MWECNPFILIGAAGAVKINKIMLTQRQYGERSRRYGSNNAVERGYF